MEVDSRWIVVDSRWIEEGASSAQIDIFCTHPFPNLLIFNGPAKAVDAISAQKGKMPPIKKGKKGRSPYQNLSGA